MGGKHHHRARERGIKKNGPEKRVPEPAADSGSARGSVAAELQPAAEAAVRARRPKAPLSDLIIKIILLLLTAACMAAVVQAVWERMEKTPEQIRPEAAEQPEETVITVNAWTVAPETMVQTVKLNGDVSSKSEISLYADTSGKLVSYTVSVGSAVKRGDVVAYIDPSKPGAPYSVNPVRSTIDGTVISLPYTLGDTLSSSSPVATVGNLDDLQIIAYASEKYASVLRTGAMADVVLAAYPERTFRAFVSQVSPVVDVSSRSIEIRLDISPARREVKPGMFASVTLVARRITGAKILPKTALRTYDDKNVVYLIDGENRARRTEIETGLSNDTHTQIVSGVEFGDRVIISGSVTDGTAVRVAGEELVPPDGGAGL